MKPEDVDQAMAAKYETSEAKERRTRGTGGRCRHCGLFDEYPTRGYDDMVCCYLCLDKEKATTPPEYSKRLVEWASAQIRRRALLDTNPLWKVV